MAANTIRTSQQELLDTFEYRDGKLYWKIKVCRRIDQGTEAGTKDTTRYRRIMVNKQASYLHRIIYFMHTGEQPIVVDHTNGNILDNRIENLRAATYAQNMHNQRLQSNTTSGLKGVSFFKQSGKWRASVTVNGKCKNIGHYLTRREAACAYNKAAQSLYGEFAKLHDLETIE